MIWTFLPQTPGRNGELMPDTMRDEWDPADIQIGRAVRLVMLARGLKANQLAELLGWHPSKMSRHLSGETSFKAVDLAATATALDCAVDTFFLTPDELLKIRWYGTSPDLELILGDQQALPLNFGRRVADKKAAILEMVRTGTASGAGDGRADSRATG